MRHIRPLLLTPLTLLGILALGCLGSDDGAVSDQARAAEETAGPARLGVVDLPAPDLRGSVPLEGTLAKRRSVRSYSDNALSLAQVAQLLWSAQGITETRRGFRTAPSAGALFPLEVYLVASNVDDLARGIFKYRPHDHKLVPVELGDLAGGVYDAALQQDAIRDAPAVICFSGVVERTSVKYGARAERYMLIEVGHAGQNVCLQAVALGLGAVTIGAFNDGGLKQALRLPAEEEPLYVIPVGRP